MADAVKGVKSKMGDLEKPTLVFISLAFQLHTVCMATSECYLIIPGCLLKYYLDDYSI